MNTKLLFIACMTTVGFGLAGCSDDDDKVASVPVYEGITVEKDVYTGQYAFAKVTYKTPGAFVLHADCNYSVTGGTQGYGSGSWRMVAPEGTEPTFKFKAPKAEGNYTVSFSARFSFYVDLANGTIYGKSNSVSANINVLRADAIDACWGDSRERLAKVLDVRDSIIAGERMKVWTGVVNYNTNQNLQADSLPATRYYRFSDEDKLTKVEEVAKFKLTRKSSYKEFEDGTSGYVYDSIDNKNAYPHIRGVMVQELYEQDGEAVLEGEAAHLYPVKNWRTYTTDIERARLVNAFWNKSLIRYSQAWIYDEVTRCFVTISCEDDELLIKCTYEPYR